ncbi:hypothetical protein [Sandaracinobacteroides hominis]|nr:hypothetical protein [Sandaracinobacteroides hominis]
MKQLQTTCAASCGGRSAGAFYMQDLIWIGLLAALLVASVIYVALCDRA